MAQQNLVQQFQNAYTQYTSKYIRSIPTFKYTPPKNPVVLCHGLSGFDQLFFIPSVRYLTTLLRNHIHQMDDDSIFSDNGQLFAIDYWIGIKTLLESKGCQVFITRVPSFGSIEMRSLALHNRLEKLALNSQTSQFNLIAHSMGGLDSRYLISNIPDKKNYKILSLTTISTPHHGSEMADFVVEQFESLKKIIPTTKETYLPICFYQLTTNYMNEYFNKTVTDDPKVKYFSYGAMFTPSWYNVFKPSWQIINDKSKGKPNDGMVTVESSHWGTYLGTLYGLDHLDIINWQNKLVVPSKEPMANIDILQFYLFITHNLGQRGF